jgi:MoxR-like ATPase
MMADLAQVQKTLASVRAQVARVIVGQEPVVDGLLTGLFLGGHVLLEGVPGLGKTLLVRTLADCLGLPFSRIQFTPDLMPADVVGTTVIDESEGGRRTFRFQPGPIFASLVLADEINRATPKTQSALLEAMQEAQVTVGGASRALPQPFCVLATQNPLEMEGTFPLPEAQLDRFLLKVHVPFPGLAELTEIMDRTTTAREQGVSRVIDAAQILELREALRAVPAAPPVVDFALRLVLATHPESEHAVRAAKEHVRVGASPRGAQALLLSAKFRATSQGRENVAFDDIRAVALPALRHRLMLSFEGEAAGVTADDVLRRVLEDVPELAPALEREALPRKA